MRKLFICISLIICLTCFSACQSANGNESLLGSRYDEYLGQEEKVVTEKISAEWKLQDEIDNIWGQWTYYEMIEAINGVDVVNRFEFLQTTESDQLMSYTKCWTFDKEDMAELVELRTQIVKDLSEEFKDADIKNDGYYAWNNISHPIGLWNEYDEENEEYHLFFRQNLEAKQFDYKQQS